MDEITAAIQEFFRRARDLDPAARVALIQQYGKLVADYGSGTDRYGQDRWPHDLADWMEAIGHPRLVELRDVHAEALRTADALTERDLPEPPQIAMKVALAAGRRVVTQADVDLAWETWRNQRAGTYEALALGSSCIALRDLITEEEARRWYTPLDAFIPLDEVQPEPRRVELRMLPDVSSGVPGVARVQSDLPCRASDCRARADFTLLDVAYCRRHTRELVVLGLKAAGR